MTAPKSTIILSLPVCPMTYPGVAGVTGVQSHHPDFELVFSCSKLLIVLICNVCGPHGIKQLPASGKHVGWESINPAERRLLFTIC
jgi:hypothetical protein